MRNYAALGRMYQRLKYTDFKKSVTLIFITLPVLIWIIFVSGCIQQPENNINNLTIEASKPQQSESLKPTLISYYEIEGGKTSV
jgi:hypothetical protein